MRMNTGFIPTHYPVGVNLVFTRPEIYIALYNYDAVASVLGISFSTTIVPATKSCSAREFTVAKNAPILPNIQRF